MVQEEIEIGSVEMADASFNLPAKSADPLVDPTSSSEHHLFFNHYNRIKSILEDVNLERYLDAFIDQNYHDSSLQYMDDSDFEEDVKSIFRKDFCGKWLPTIEGTLSPDKISAAY